MKSADFIQKDEAFGAHNYHPLPVVISEAKGVWVHDPEGKRYMDMLAAYSAVNFGHGHQPLIDAAKAQLDRVTLTSRAFHNDQLGVFCEKLAALCGMEKVLPMNTGAEAVETAIKTARKWGYTVKGVPENEAKVLVCSGNFHGRTISIVSFSDDEQARGGFGPYTPGFEIVPYGDADALEAAIDEHTVGFLMEPVQGEGGIVIPPEGYLRRVRELCTKHNVLWLADEIQAGLGRTGKTFATDWEDAKPDLYILGKALGGGIVPVSAVVSTNEILGVFTPGDHGSTFGGNPLAAAVGNEVVKILQTGHFQENALKQGAKLEQRLREANLESISAIRARGLWFGIDIDPAFGDARHYCERLMAEGILCKGTHVHTIRLAPPLCIDDEELDWASERLLRVLSTKD